MNWNDLDFLGQPKGKTFERKRDLSSPPSVLRSIVAFANGAGGQLVIGVEDDGVVVGVEDAILEEERLADIVAHGITPLVVPDIAMVGVGDRTVLVTTVHPSSRRPHHLTADSAADGTYVRIGSSNRRADEELRVELARSARRRGFDEEPAVGVSLDALQLDDIPGLRNPITKTQARTLEIVTEIDGVELPTNAGVQVAAPTVLGDRFPDAVVHAVMFADDDTALVRREIRGTIFDLADRSIAFIHEMVGDAVRVTGATAANSASSIAPHSTVRELVINAFVHADYSLRGALFRIAIRPGSIEVESPGLLVPGLAIADLGRGVSRVRNRAIARVFREAGYIEQWGSGTRRAIDAARAAGLADPVFAELPPHRFRATIFTTARGDAPLPAPQRQLVDAFVANHSSTGYATAQLAALTGRSERWVRSHAGDLVDLGLLRVVGSGPQRRYVLRA